MPLDIRDLQNQITEIQRELDRLRIRIGNISTASGFDYLLVQTTSVTLDIAGPRIIYVDDDTAGGVVTVTLPAKGGADKATFEIKKLGSTANVIIDGNGSETIDGATTAVLTQQYECLTLHCRAALGWGIL